METNVKIEKLQYLQIGRQGENDSLAVNIDMTTWVQEHPGIDLACFVLMQRPGEQTAWPMTSTWNATTNILTWTVSVDATAIQGTGYAEIRAIDRRHDPEAGAYDGIIKKSRVIPVLIDNSVSHVSGAAIPAPYQDFLDQVLAVKSELNDVFAGATTEYVISESYDTIPTTGWDDEYPDVSENKGKYVWARLGFEWGTTEDPTYLYTVTYIAMDGDGSVDNVNGKTGNVVLDGNDINVDDDAATPETLKAAVGRLTDAATANGIMNAASAAIYNPSVNDFLLVGLSSGVSTYRIKLDKVLDNLTKAKVYEKTGCCLGAFDFFNGISRSSQISKSSVSTSRGTVYFRKGYYKGNFSYDANKYYLTANVVGNYQDDFVENGLILGHPVIYPGSQYGNSGYVYIPYLQITSDENEGMPPSSIMAHLFYLTKG